VLLYKKLPSANKLYLSLGKDIITQKVICPIPTYLILEQTNTNGKKEKTQERQKPSCL
jgi:hypothetical protein